jgi:hypothetical protein
MQLYGLGVVFGFQHCCIELFMRTLLFLRFKQCHGQKSELITPVQIVLVIVMDERKVLSVVIRGHGRHTFEVVMQHSTAIIK